MCDIPCLMSFMIYKKCISLNGGFYIFFMKVVIIHICGRILLLLYWNVYQSGIMCDMHMKLIGFNNYLQQQQIPVASHFYSFSLMQIVVAPTSVMLLAYSFPQCSTSVVILLCRFYLFLLQQEVSTVDRCRFLYKSINHINKGNLFQVYG